tara:strand:+ start:176 stop:1378 length:1203 start_codon:yes stop_codon:yes gene_type:complete
MTGSQKLRVAFDRFDEKGPFPNLNDSLIFDRKHKEDEKSRYSRGHFIIPWIFNKFDSEEIELLETPVARGKVIYPVGIKHTKSIYTISGPQQFDKVFNIHNHDNIDYFVIYLEEEPISPNDFYIIKNKFEELVDRKKLIFICNNLEICKGAAKNNHAHRIGVGMELTVLRLLDYGPTTLFHDKSKKSKKFSIFNYSNNSDYDFRQATISYLNHANLLEHAHYSHKKVEEINFESTENKELNLFFKGIVERDSKKIIKSEIYSSSQMVKLINDSYFSIVLEAYFENPSLKQTYVTEKSFRPIFSKRPFIIVGQKGTLRGLKERGYKTFHPFINEEYDNEKDPIQRYFKVLFEINKLCKLSIEELHNFMEPLKEIIEYNYNHFYERIEFEKQYLKDLINENT